MDGWIKLHRKLLEHPIFKKEKHLRLWIYILLRANFEDTTILWNGKLLYVPAGSFITGRDKLSEETKIKPTTIEDILKDLEVLSQIRQQKTTKFRVITILNWHDYQNSDNKATTKRQQSDTNKNDKKERITKLASPKQLMPWKEYNENKPADYIPTIGDHDGEKLTNIPKAKLPAIYEWMEIWNQYPNWKALKKAGTPPNPTVQKQLLPIAIRSRDIEGSVLRRRNKYSTEEFAKAVKNYAQEICNRTPSKNGYHEHRHTLYDFLIKKTVLESYVNR